MNCKPNDRAIVIRRNGNGANLGKVVRCIKLMPTFRSYEHVWVTDTNLLWVDHDGIQLSLKAAPDSCLRPLKGDLPEKEMLEKMETW